MQSISTILIFFFLSQTMQCILVAGVSAFKWKNLMKNL